jgi:Domain of unknown function (DUF4124)
MRALIVSVVFLLLCSPAAAVDIYRWVDENGKVHVSDVVPERYKKTAKRIDSTQFEASGADRRAAEERAAADRTRGQASAANGAAATVTAPPPPSEQAAKGKLPSQTECEAAQRRYKESVDCFAPFTNTNGSTRAEAFAKCTSVPDPSLHCGPPKPLE